MGMGLSNVCVCYESPSSSQDRAEPNEICLSDSLESPSCRHRGCRLSRSRHHRIPECPLVRRSQMKKSHRCTTIDSFTPDVA